MIVEGTTTEMQTTSTSEVPRYLFVMFASLIRLKELSACALRIFLTANPESSRVNRLAKRK